MKKTLFTIVGIIVVLALMLISMYNKLVNLDENAGTAWAQVETVLQRRYDLIPNLVNTVKGYAAHESNLFEEITRLRSQWGEAKTTDQKAEAATQMEGALGRLMVVVENYPELKANQNFMALQDELTGTENRISVERRRFNEVVREYNMAVRRFPANLLAGLFGFDPKKSYFEATEGAEKAPTVAF
ncbi:MAG: LemA family protein [Kiritimatiellae bacterium]|nr:LemA family protein [Kiritimatiellia bacterium]